MALSYPLVSTDHQIYFYTVPSLDPFPIKPIRHVVTFAVDDQHLKRPPPSLSPQGVRLPVEPVDFCIIKRAGLAMYTLKDRLSYLKVRFLFLGPYIFSLYIYPYFLFPPRKFRFLKELLSLEGLGGHYA